MSDMPVLGAAQTKFELTHYRFVAGFAKRALSGAMVRGAFDGRQFAAILSSD